jgi:Flp pilus assembly protein TadG
MQDPTRQTTVLRRAFSRLRQTLRDQRGVSAVAFAISFAVLAPMALGIFDVYTQTEQRGKLQDALDAAALYAARSPAYTTADVDAIGDKALTANLQLIHGAALRSSDFTLVGNKVVAQASVQLAAFAPMEFTHTPVTVNSEVTRSGNNLEVALVLDNSTSMAGASLTSLKSAANSLVDLVVSDTQTPFYSKVSIIPYGNGVNVGNYATAARGATQAGTNPTIGVNGATPYANFKFNNRSGGTVTWTASTCVSERTGAQAYTDAAPTTALVGLNYPATANGNPCISAKMAPLSSDKVALHTSIGNLTSCCSTAGHVGVAWGWYTLSPNWSGLFTGNAAPAAYGAEHTIKALVLMTDGEYNSVYCKGVIAQMNTNSSATGSGSDNDHINCNGTNGKDAYAQAQSLCTAMKAAPNNVIIYTVGLNVVGTPAAAALVNNCATDAQHVYLPANGTAMQVAFQSIAADLNRLRISH